MTDNDGSLREPPSGTGAAGTKPTTSRRGRADDGSREQLAVPRARFRSYYGRPVLKTPVWEWRIPAYLFTGGLSAGAALLAAGADLTGRPALRREAVTILTRAPLLDISVSTFQATRRSSWIWWMEIELTISSPMRSSLTLAALGGPLCGCH